METSCWTRAVAEGDQESCRGEKLAVLCRSVVLKSHDVHWVSGWPCSPYTAGQPFRSLAFSSSPRDSATMLPDTPSHVLNWATSCGWAADTTACCILVSYQTRELNSDTVCAESSSNFIFKFSLMEMSFLPHTLSTLLYPPTHPPTPCHGGTVLLTPRHNMAALKSSLPCTQAVLTTIPLVSILLQCSNIPLFYYLLRVQPWLHHHHSTSTYSSTSLPHEFVCYLLLLSPLLPTWCVYPSTPAIKNSSTSPAHGKERTTL